MVHKGDTLKSFIDKHIMKGYINFKKNKEGIFELYTPRKERKLGIDPRYEEIFKAYENYRHRPYKGYSCRDTLKAAIKKSKIYRVLPKGTEKIFRFQKRTPHEIANLQKKKRKSSKNMVVTSPETSGYETCENSPVPSPNPLKSNDCTSVNNTPQDNSGYINFDDVNMEEITDEALKNDPIQELCHEPYRKFFSSDLQFHQGEYRKIDYTLNVNAANMTVLSADINSGLQGGCGINDPTQNVSTGNLTVLSDHINSGLQGEYENNDYTQNVSTANLIVPSADTELQGEYGINDYTQNVNASDGTVLSFDINSSVQDEYRKNDYIHNVSSGNLTVQSADINSGIQGEYLQNDFTQNVNAANLTVLSADTNSGLQGVYLKPKWKCAALYQVPGHFVRFVTKPNTYSLNICNAVYVLQPLKQ